MDIGQPAPGVGSPITFTWVGTSTSVYNGSIYGNDVFEMVSGSGWGFDAVGETTVLYSGGQSYIWANGGTGVIKFGQGITADDIILQSGDTNLVIRVRGTDDEIVIYQGLTVNEWGVSSAINQLRFSDGSTMDIGQPAPGVGSPITFTWTGSPGSAINGSSFGINIFEMGSGVETFGTAGSENGSSGNDTYIASRDTGEAHIYANGAVGPTNELVFDGGITDENLWFLQSGNDLKIDVLGSASNITIHNWYVGSSTQLDDVAAGGLKIDSQISQLVQAMATYSANNPGFDPTSSSIHELPSDSGLQNAVAAAWHA
ncbi:hypothetical protein ONR75_27290 [Rhodopseudomonas sp. P2A-2r]|uniref:calcium-binding protein n=1 Tax=Rhodopseudomonas sp. P2A-2r TaxID=2991972 RepID=UPI002234933F|nr:calcium-binding protein [Rhodopseudomonas sp. P2A-2r]UZE48462.1 hypothetical protein ONR75_27290 [Rhodopseudomonas sp. P2A-2r]